MANVRTHESNPVGLDVDVEVGIIVQSLMFRHRQKQSDLGAILGIGVPTVSKKLRGMVAFSIRDLYAISRAYNVDPADLLPSMGAPLLPRLDSNQQPFD